jgi:SAM-dependent methyltransferase
MSEQSWIPNAIPLDRPSPARIYDCLLGGYHNFAIDREIAGKMKEICPEMSQSAQANRAFLRRAVRFVMAQGIDQILDLGSGIPTVGNVHEEAQAINPEARVVYVDIDPVAVAHSNAILEDNLRAVAIQADVRDIEGILALEQVQDLLDFGKPLAVLMVAVLHYVVDDEKALHVVQETLRSLAPDSYLVVAHATTEYEPPGLRELGQLFGQASTTKRRSRAQIKAFFEGQEMVEPGLVWTPLWRPEDDDDVFIDEPHLAFTLAGVIRKA